MRGSRIVTAPKSFAIIIACASWNMRMAIFIPIIHVRVSMVIEVLAGALNPIMVSLALNVAKFLRRRIPASMILAIARRSRRAILLRHG
jgi:hypothetical protein